MRGKDWEFEWDKADRIYRRTQKVCLFLWVCVMLAASARAYFFG